MLDQSDNLNYCFLFLGCYFSSIFVLGNCSFKTLFYIFKKFDIVVNRQSKNSNISLASSIWNIAPVVAVTTSYSISSAFGSPALNVLDISDNTQFFDHLKSSSISQLSNGESRDVQKLRKYFHGIIASSFLLPVCFVLYSKGLC